MTNPSERKRVARSAEVVSTRWISPRMVRVTFAGDDLRTLPPLEFTDCYIKILFPPSGADYGWPFDPDELRATRPAADWPVTRTYTIRALDPSAGEMSVDFVVHGDEGLAGPWAANAQAGERIGFFGPGGAYAPDPAATQYLFVGDEAALPAIAAALERLPSDGVAGIFIEVEDPADHQPMPLTTRSTLTWVHRGPLPYGEALAEAVRSAGLPAGRLEAFVHGNAEMVRSLRRWLFVENRVDRRSVSISGYWRTGQTEDRWQATKRDFNQEIEAAEAAALVAAG